MGDIIDRAQQYDEIFRQSAIAVHFADRQAVAAQRPAVTSCEDCGEKIPAARRKAAPEATRCIGCQEKQERIYGRHS